MSSATVSTGFTPETFDAFLRSRNEPEWLVNLRKHCWEAFQRMDWPARNDEEWIRTDIRLLKLSQFGLPLDGTKAEAAVPSLLSEGVQLAGQVSSVDGRPQSATVDKKWQDKGVIFGSLDEVAKTHSDLVQKYLLTRAVNPEYDRFAALHGACWSGGHFLYVPRNVSIGDPFHFISALSGGGADLSHTLIVLEEGAEATVMCETASLPVAGGATGAGFHNGATEVILAPRAMLRLVSLQNWSDQVWNFAHQKALVGHDSTLQWTIAAMGSRLSKVNQHVELCGKGAECQVNGVLFTEGKQHISYHTLQHHAAPGCRSDFLYKAALQDKSRTVWRGMIKVDPLAQKTDGYQRNDNLMLSTEARADSIPGLEIEADDVRCTHGSTTGKVDEELIFYAQARGLTRQEATRIIVSGFFQQIFDRITIESVRNALGHAILRRVREYS
ncbi:FeS cluster assembly protein SufB [Anatilimnocola aggregata]|uniref:FeS cluster assembly protein SufB n=1 Tax=Anatilimnocola aggregata TaxID=2528021 RepID=A0A517Y9K8_9BACT|nr:Fe-S cluster assembly protein SufD [Anatilimnocola aggregata]QDU26920.1 FeS cluster assembly protein SufB [Anatilimnocola aggregata]